MLLNVFCALALAQTAPTGSEVTVYNQGFALVKENRTFDLKEGRQTLAVEDVASQIETNSVGIRSITEPGSFEVLEQNYRFDLINPWGILNKAVGRKITLNRVLPNGQKESIVGTLLSSPTAIVADQNGGSEMTYNGLVLKTDDGRILLDPHGEIEVNAIPEGMISKPTLLWDLVAKKAGQNQIELSYITQGMTWNADYVLTLDGQGTAGLRGWVTMTNNSGTTYENAKLKLLAGEVNTVQNRNGVADTGVDTLLAMDAAKKPFKEETLFEYHLYTLERPATLRDKEIKQLSLLEGIGVKYVKRLIVDSMRDFGQYYPSEGEVGTGNLKPQVRVEFVNSEENGLGIPMPKGNVKVYQHDQSGSVQMLGEDRIDHTPKNEKISLVVGRSFDVVAERKRTNFQKISDTEFKETFEIEVRNRKDTAQTVEVIERHYGDWKVTDKNMPFKKLDAISMLFNVELKPGESKKVVYTVDTRW